jgi:choline dehydrogenase
MRLSPSYILAAVSALGLFHGVTADTQAKSLTYEYIVVGSGPGGGTVASRLARAGHSVLLIEAGDDQGTNLNYTVPAFSPASVADEKMSWEFYVQHYADLTRAERDPKFVYDIGNGQKHVGFNPPAGSKPLGILCVFPRYQ